MVLLQPGVRALRGEDLAAAVRGGGALQEDVRVLQVSGRRKRGVSRIGQGRIQEDDFGTRTGGGPVLARRCRGGGGNLLQSAVAHYS